MLIVREESRCSNYSFYLNKEGVTIGVWENNNQVPATISYYHYHTTINFNQPNRWRSSELEFLVLVGRTAEEMFELGIKASYDKVMDVGKVI